MFKVYVWIDSRRTLRWRHNGRDSASNHQPHHCLLNCLFRRRSKKTSKLRVTGLCVGNSPVTGEFPAQMASNAENVSIWWRHHEIGQPYITTCSPIPCLFYGSLLFNACRGEKHFFHWAFRVNKIYVLKSIPYSLQLIKRYQYSANQIVLLAIQGIASSRIQS